jgi:hypothetical protein
VIVLTVISQNKDQTLSEGTKVRMVVKEGHFAASISAPNWRELYTGALLEGDHRQLGLRIEEAEGAIVLRRGELFATPDDTVEEEVALDDALYFLRALRTCLQLKTREPIAA